MAPGVSRKTKKKPPTPWYLTTPFVLSMSAIALSILITLEPVAILLDEFLGTATSDKAQRALASRGMAGGSLMNQEADALCAARPGTCTPAPTDTSQSFQITLINKSLYRADIYWDNGNLGQVVANIEGQGTSMQMTVYPGNTFFITRHGVKEGLFDLQTDLQHKFAPTKAGATFIIPESAAPSNNPCQDRFEACQSYAAAGKCWETPGWMIVHCCQSCDKYSPELQPKKYIDSTVRCTKEFMNITDPVWKPGDLNDLFTKWSTSPEFEKYQPQILSSPDVWDENGVPQPWVMTFDNFFTPEEAQALIKGGDLAGFDRSTNQGSVNAQGEMEMVTSTTRTSSNAWCTGACQQLPGVKTMTQRIEQVTGISDKNYEPFQVLEYQDNQFYKMHHDSEGRDPKPPGNRILTFFLYLSDVEEGGETRFNKLDINVKPKLGRALVWPSVRNEDPGFWDDRMYHEAMPIIKGKKYAANHWIHLNDYEGPNRWGCTGSFS